MNARVSQKRPCLVNEKCFEDGCDCLIRDDSVGVMKDVEEQRLENVGVLAHRLKVKTLEFGERDRVLHVVEQKPELPSTGPFRQAVRHALTESVREYAQGAQGRVHGIEVFDLMVEVAFGREIGRRRVGKECRSRWSPYH